MDAQRRNRLLIVASAVFAGAYLLSLPLGAFPAKPLVKTPAVLLLCLYAALDGVGKERLLLVAALFMSAMGDMFLALPDQYFLHGLASFLIAHLFYIALFLRHRARTLMVTHISTAVVLALYGIALVWWMLPSLGSMTVPVMVYAFVLLCMGAAARFSRFGSPWVFGGAVLFIVSDSALAVNKFHTPLEGFGYVVWLTYYFAQVAITLGVLLGPRISKIDS